MLTKNGLPRLSILQTRSTSLPHKTFVAKSGPGRQIAARWQSTDTTATSAEPLSRRRTATNNEVLSICYIPNPSDTDPSTIIAKLPKLLHTDCEKLSKVLFLVSPGIARWFRPDSTFHQNAVNHIFSSVLPERPSIESLVAVVDALPPPEHFQDRDAVRTRPYSPIEGIATCLRSTPIRRIKKVPSSTRESVLRVRSSLHSGEVVKDLKPAGGHAEPNTASFTFVTIPLANTLFINGSRNTAFQQAWKATEDRSFFRPQRDSEALEEVDLYTNRDCGQEFYHDVPLYPLTTSREVLSSMGNVVRELKGDDGKPLRASAELEAIVPRMLAKQKERNEEAQIQIYAKAMPSKPNSSASANNTSPISPTSKIEEDFETVSYSETLNALHQQGQFYRVTSGGGGWGKKAGLLSLDPATNFAPSKDSEISMFPDPDQTDDSSGPTREVGALVPVGHSIQFFAAQVQQPYPQQFASRTTQRDLDSVAGSRTNENGQSVKFHRIVIGTMPSSDTFQPVDAQDAKNALPFVLPNCFGALSEGGASISLEKAVRDEENSRDTCQTINEFRVDVPHAMFKLFSPLQ